MEIYLTNLSNGEYGAFKSSFLRFDVGNGNHVEINKKSALEIVHTLIDSLGMLDKDAEELICKMQEKIENL